MLSAYDKEEQNALKAKPTVNVPCAGGKTKDGKLNQIKVPYDVVADAILKRFNIFNMQDTKQIYIYNNGVYKSEGAEAILETSIMNVHDEIYNAYWRIINPEFELTHIPKATTNYINEVIAYIRSYTHRPRTVLLQKIRSFYKTSEKHHNWAYRSHKTIQLWHKKQLL